MRLSILIMPRGFAIRRWPWGAGRPARGSSGGLWRIFQGHELGIWALAGYAEPGVSSVGLFLGCRLVLPEIRDLRVAASR